MTNTIDCTGSKIREVMEKRDLSYGELAALTGISKSTLQRYAMVRGSKIPLDKVIMIAKALRVTPAFLMGWEEEPSITISAAASAGNGFIAFPIIGDVAAGFERRALEDRGWDGDTVRIPVEDLRGRPASDFFALRVSGDSMYPQYQEGDIVLVLRQATLNRSGDVGVVLYNSEEASLKKVDFVMGEDWMRLVPVNPIYPPVLIENEDLEKCRVLGIPWMLVRYIED